VAVRHLYFGDSFVHLDSSLRSSRNAARISFPFRTLFLRRTARFFSPELTSVPYLYALGLLLPTPSMQNQMHELAKTLPPPRKQVLGTLFFLYGSADLLLRLLHISRTPPAMLVGLGRSNATGFPAKTRQVRVPFLTPPSTRLTPRASIVSGILSLYPRCPGS
jgi:hypothetical protein